MNLRDQLWKSLLAQGIGAASMLLATLLLGVELGPEQQGRFSHTKAEIEFVAAIATFGLPQALFFFVKSAQLSIEAALRWTFLGVLGTLPISVAYGFVQHGHFGVSYVAGLVMAIACCVALSHLRALLLISARIEWFNGVTALPQVLVLGGVVVVVLSVTRDLGTWQILFAAAYGAAALLSFWRVKAMQTASVVAAVGRRGLSRYGMAAWLMGILSTSAVLFVQHWVERSQGAPALGQLTMAMTLVQVPLTPVSYAAPLLFRFWMEQPGGHASLRWAAALFAMLLFVAALVGVIAHMWPQLGLGRGYAGVTHALAILLIGGAAEAASRVLTANVNATGQPWVGVSAETARWLVLGGAWLLLSPEGLLSICAVWAAGAWVAAAVLAMHTRCVLATEGHPA